jgi:hypothetical protein
MSRALLALSMLLALGAGACATSHQSARVLAPGKTQVTTALARTSSSDEVGEGLWNGDLQVHGGVAPGVELGGRLVRTPGGGNTLSGASLEGRFQVVPERVAIAVPVGFVWQEEFDDFEGGAYTLTPTVFVGADVSPTLEVVAAPKLFVFIPDEGDGDTEVEWGGSVGLRVTNEARTWALHPELGLAHFSEDDGSGETFLTFGLGVSVGN